MCGGTPCGSTVYWSSRSTERAARRSPGCAPVFGRTQRRQMLDDGIPVFGRVKYDNPGFVSEAVDEMFWHVEGAVSSAVPDGCWTGHPQDAEVRSLVQGWTSRDGNARLTVAGRAYEGDGARCRARGGDDRIEDLVPTDETSPRNRRDGVRRQYIDSSSVALLPSRRQQLFVVGIIKVQGLGQQPERLPAWAAGSATLKVTDHPSAQACPSSKFFLSQLRCSAVVAEQSCQFSTTRVVHSAHARPPGCPSKIARNVAPCAVLTGAWFGPHPDVASVGHDGLSSVSRLLESATSWKTSRKSEGQRKSMP